jgi:hypothetical protein
MSALVAIFLQQSTSKSLRIVTKYRYLGIAEMDKGEDHD